MARWQPGARGRLQAAALDLFANQGYDGTTVAEIATTAGLTERTFYRYFADKREVLFYGQSELERVFLTGIAEAADGDPMSIVAGAIAGAGTMFDNERRPWSRVRQAVIDTVPNLQERELLKLSSLAVAMTRALIDRGVNPTAAALAAESGVAVFRVAFGRWIAEGEQGSLAELITVVFGELRSLVAPTP